MPTINPFSANTTVRTLEFLNSEGNCLLDFGQSPVVQDSEDTLTFPILYKIWPYALSAPADTNKEFNKYSFISDLN